jgi:hypothetical protein
LKWPMRPSSANGGDSKGWVDQDREFLLWSQRLRASLLEWERTDHDVETLLRGAPLTEAERWLAERPQDLPPAEQDFIHESVAARERERAARERSRRRITLGAVAAAVVFLVLGAFAGVQWWRAGTEARRAEEQARIATSNEQRADEQRRIALSRQLTAQATNRLGSHLGPGPVVGIGIWLIAHSREIMRSVRAERNKPRLSVAIYGLPTNRTELFVERYRSTSSAVARSPFDTSGRTLLVGSWKIEVRSIFTVICDEPGILSHS